MTKIAGTFSGKINWQTATSMPHAPGHELSLGEISGPQQCSDPNWQDVTITYWGYADLVEGNGTQRGHWVNNHADGDQDYGTFEGRITTSEGQTQMEGTWEYKGGTGKFAKIRGGGAYKGHFPGPGLVENAWEGEYEL